MAEVQAELQALKATRQRHAEQLEDQVSLHQLIAPITCCAASTIIYIPGVAQNADGCRRTHTAVNNVPASLLICTSLQQQC